MPPVLPQYTSLPSSANLALEPLRQRTRDSLDHSDTQSGDEKQFDVHEETDYEDRLDADGREGLLSGRRKREVEGDEDRDTLADALRLEGGKREWMRDIQVRAKHFSPTQTQLRDSD